MLQLVEPQPALQGRRVRRGVAGEHDVSRGSWFAAHPALEREVGRVHECEGLAHRDGAKSKCEQCLGCRIINIGCEQVVGKNFQTTYNRNFGSEALVLGGPERDRALC